MPLPVPLPDLTGERCDKNQNQRKCDMGKKIIAVHCITSKSLISGLSVAGLTKNQ
jgi:hypothetical protein